MISFLLVFAMPFWLVKNDSFILFLDSFSDFYKLLQEWVPFCFSWSFLFRTWSYFFRTFGICFLSCPNIDSSHRYFLLVALWLIFWVHQRCFLLGYFIVFYEVLFLWTDFCFLLNSSYRHLLNWIFARCLNFGDFFCTFWGLAFLFRHSSLLQIPHWLWIRRFGKV